MKRLSEARNQVIGARARLANINNEKHSQEAISLAIGGCEGQLGNLKLIERVMKPVQEYLSFQSGRKSWLGNFYPVESGWPCLQMIGYFYRDWGNTEEARFLTDLFTDAIKDYCGDDRRSAAVLGCGACGLVYDMAELFSVVSGLDLSIDTLLLSKWLLDGGILNLQFNLPSDQYPISQKTVSLNGPARKRGSIELVSASVKKLPFTSSSISCVLTSFLIDIIPSPSAIVEEIHRVLAPDGIWINFSNPPKWDDPSDVESFEGLNYLDMPSYLKRSGFILLDSVRHKFKLIDLSAISEWAHINTWTPVFFVAKKNSSHESDRRDYFAEYFAGNVESIWQATPKISQPIALRVEKVFKSNDFKERKVVALPNLGAGLAINNEHAVVVEWLLHNIDGVRTTREILNLVRKKYGALAEAEDLIKFFRKLQESGIVKFKQA
jgi:SAM-dependent methyltransferase